MLVYPVQDLHRLLHMDGFAKLGNPVHEGVGVKYRHRHVLHTALLVKNRYAGDIGRHGPTAAVLGDAGPCDVPPQLNHVFRYGLLKQGALLGDLGHAAPQHLLGHNAHMLAVSGVNVSGDCVLVRNVHAVQQAVHHLLKIHAFLRPGRQLVQQGQRLFHAPPLQAAPDMLQGAHQ